MSQRCLDIKYTKFNFGEVTGMHSESSGLVATSTLKFVEGLSFFLLKAVIETEINKKIQIDLRAAPSYFMYLS